MSCAGIPASNVQRVKLMLMLMLMYSYYAFEFLKEQKRGHVTWSLEAETIQVFLEV